MSTKLNTTVDFEFSDGTTEKLTLTFYDIYQLKSRDKELYDKYCQIMAKGITEDLEVLTILYIAYCCANSDKENLMSEEDFIIKCGFERGKIYRVLRELTNPKKQ